MADDGVTAAVDRGLVLAALEMLAGQWDEVARRAAGWAAQAGHPADPAVCRARAERALGLAMEAQRVAQAVSNRDTLQPAGSGRHPVTPHAHN